MNIREALGVVGIAWPLSWQVTDAAIEKMKQDHAFNPETHELVNAHSLTAIQPRPVIFLDAEGMRQFPHVEWRRSESDEAQLLSELRKHGFMPEPTDAREGDGEGA